MDWGEKFGSNNKEYKFLKIWQSNDLHLGVIVTTPPPGAFEMSADVFGCHAGWMESIGRRCYWHPLWGPGMLLDVLQSTGQLSRNKELSSTKYQWCWGWETLTLTTVDRYINCLSEQRATLFKKDIKIYMFEHRISIQPNIQWKLSRLANKQVIVTQRFV